MLLGDFNSIYIGDTSIDAVYIGSDLVWSSNPTTMPHLDGVLCYYDCDDGIGTEGGNPAWVNRISGGSNMALHNASVAQDGAISFYGGNDPGNGKFSCNTTENATMYVLFKRTGDGNADNYIHICGSVANGQHFPYVGGSSSLWIHGIQFMLNSNVYTDAYTGLFQYDITGNAIRDFSLSCLDYHVVCCIRQKNGAVYDNLMYVDGIYFGRIDGSLYPPGTNYGVCIGVDSFGYEDKTHDGYDTLIKMIAVSNQAHTAQQVVENSLWLLDHFNINIYTPLEYIQSTNCQTINTGYTPNENSRIEAEFMLYTSVHNEWGQALFSNGSWKMYYNRNRALRTEYQFGSGSITTTASVLPYHKQFKLVCDKNGATWYDTEGVQIGNVSVTGTSPGSSALYIGSDSNSYYSEYRIYSFKVYEGDTLVMNLTPIQRNGDGVCGLLDTISGKFFMDAGHEGVGYYSDKFEDSYERLEAVDTNRNLYVDTDYIAKTNTKLVIDGISHRGSLYLEGYLFGSWYNQTVGPDTIAFCSVLNTSTSGGTSPFTRGTGNIWLPTAALSDKHAIFTMYGTALTVHDVDTDTDTTYTVQNTTVEDCKNTLYLFGINRTPSAQVMDTCATARCYNCKISEITNDVETLIRDFVPVKRKFDNIIVLYDTVTNSEYSPVGGAFTEYSVMPVMDGITNYYDCKRDVTIGGYWKSQVKFYEKSYDMPLGGNISIADDGAITMTGDSSGYAWFCSATADYTTRSAYVIAKADASTIHSQNPVLLGVSSAGGDKNTVSIATQRNTNVLDLDLWGANVESVVNSSDYHVCVWTRNGSINSFYVDGVLIGTLDVSNKYYANYSTYQGCEEQLWGVGCLFRGNSYNSWGDKVQKYFKFIAIADTAHTSEQIAENTAWLKNYYNLD